MSYDCTKQFINGHWVESRGASHPIINPADESVIGQVAYGTSEEVDQAVKAARAAFEEFSQWSVERRVALLTDIAARCAARRDDLAAAITAEMGAPKKLSENAQAPLGAAHFSVAAGALKQFEFEQQSGDSIIIHEPIGVCGLITPWNWPLNQIACKVAPAFAAGCTVVLKPSEIAPVDATILAEIIDEACREAGAPDGIFNLVNGDGPGVGAAIAAHPDIDMVSFTGSTRAGVLVAKAAADNVKRVAQELGGKSPNIILESAPLKNAITHGVRDCFSNTGQSCNAPSRMLVPQSLYEEAVQLAAEVAGKIRIGDPESEATHMGPLSSEIQYNKVQNLIQKGMSEGSHLVCGGPGRPEGFDKGYFVKPTIFRDVDNEMTIAREEIFGPVLAMIPYSNLDEAIAIANDTPYGLSAYVYGGSREEALAVARRLRTGMVHLNGAGVDVKMPFGGYKQSGNGREWGQAGIEDYLETKAVMAA
jgi:aldehyde dehydrogenase (NAD+)